MAQDFDTSTPHTIEFDEAALAVEREEVQQRVRTALTAHAALFAPHTIDQHRVVRRAYDQACAQLIPVRHLLLQVAA